VKLTVDCDLTAELSTLQNAELQQHSSLAYLLSKAKVTQVAAPLEALICEQYGLFAAPDYAIAAIAANADGLDVSEGYWLRADPVNLVLQRDCFSLGEPIPLMVEPEYAKGLVASLNQHFSQDGLTFLIGKSGAWYLHSNTDAQIKTTLPSVAAGKNVHQFMPQGEQASKWLAVLNEAQMLLHEHPVNAAREADASVAVNSVWLSGGGQLPQIAAPNNHSDLLVASSAFYQGLAKLTNTPYLVVPDNLDDIFRRAEDSTKHIRLQVPQVNNLDSLRIKPLIAALKNKRINQLTLNLGFYEKSLVVEITPFDLYQFWRRTKPVAHYLT
jgi:hypothetical protein